MHSVQLHEAEIQLASLLNEVVGGEDVMITRGDGFVFKIIPILPKKPRPTFGSAKGLIKMSEDFDEPLEDLRGF